jgi:hypothetical protein
MAANVSRRFFDVDFGMEDDEEVSAELEDEGFGVRLDLILDDFVDSLFALTLPLVDLLLRDDATLGSGSNNVSLTSSRVRIRGGDGGVGVVIVVSLVGFLSHINPFRRHTSYTRSNCLASTALALCAFPTADSFALLLLLLFSGETSVSSLLWLHDDDGA